MSGSTLALFLKSIQDEDAESNGWGYPAFYLPGIQTRHCHSESAAEATLNLNFFCNISLQTEGGAPVSRSHNSG